MPEALYQDPFPQGKDDTKYRLLTKEYVSVSRFNGKEVLVIDPEGLAFLAHQAFRDVSYLLRPAHQEKMAAILSDPESSPNDPAAPVATPRDAHSLSRGAHKTYTEENLRYSQTIPLTMYEEKNSGTNLPAQIDLYATEGPEYKFLFVAKGGGSANKTYLFQETKALRNPASNEKTLVEKRNTPGRAAARVGGDFAALEVGGSRLPRRGASCPVGMGVSCSADRNIKARIDKEGIWLEEMERNPGRLIPEKNRKKHDHGVVKIDLGRPMKEILAELSKYHVTTQISLTGPLVVGRHIANARIKEGLH